MSHLESGSDYHNWMMANYPGYAQLEEFSNMKSQYLDLPRQQTKDERYGSDVDSINESSSACAATLSEVGTFGDSEYLPSRISDRSFIVFDIDDVPYDDILDDIDDDSMIDPHAGYPAEGDIPISMWDDSASIDDEIVENETDEDDDEVYTPVDESEAEPEYVQQLRESIGRMFPAPSPSDPIDVLVTESLAPLDDSLIISPVDCFADICWASHPQSHLDIPQIILHPSVDILPDDPIPIEEDALSLSPAPSDDISFSPPPRPLKCPNGFKRFAQRFRLDSFGRKRI